ncbi:MAG: universal stress protein [Candidatus Solibacter sp.]
MPRLNRLLVPVEFSPRCRGAVQYAEALASHFHCEIVLLHVVIPPLANFSSFEAMAYTSAADLAREIAAQRTLQLDDFPCSVPADCSIRRLVLEGDPTQTIVDFAEREKCNLIVMPTRGYGPFRRFLLGSVTAKVLHDAICPVWTGPHMEAAPSFSTMHFHNIACAIDLGLHSREVICWAAGFAAEFDAHLTLIHAIPASATRLGGFYFDPDWRTQLTRTAMERISSMRDDMGVEASVAIEAGQTPVVVASAVETLKADLLVIGRGSTPRAHGHLPTNAYAIVRESLCPVVTV